jgi:hypothetical protein
MKTIEDDIFEMEMPVPCDGCGEWVELNECRHSPLTQKLVCRNCAQRDKKTYDIRSRIEELQLDLDDNAEYMKGNRRGYKKELKDLKMKLTGFENEEIKSRPFEIRNQLNSYN